MISKITTIEGDLLDDICFRHYGRHGGTTEAVLAANSGLAAYGLRLPEGVMITMPELPEAAQDQPVTLYD